MNMELQLGTAAGALMVRASHWTTVRCGALAVRRHAVAIAALPDTANSPPLIPSNDAFGNDINRSTFEDPPVAIQRHSQHSDGNTSIGRNLRCLYSTVLVAAFIAHIPLPRDARRGQPGRAMQKRRHAWRPGSPAVTTNCEDVATGKSTSHHKLRALRRRIVDRTAQLGHYNEISLVGRSGLCTEFANTRQV